MAQRQTSLAERLTQAWTTRGPLACLLWPVSLAYATLGLMRRFLYQAGIFKVERVPVPVLVVGNVVVGGAGKTPVVVALVKHLQARGLKVGVISRGYGRATKTCLEVRTNSAARDVGDEPAVIYRSTLAPVFVAVRRIEAARQLLLQHPSTQVIVCDDGLQHLGLHRDLEICVFDDRGVGNGWQLPAGPLREPWPRAVDFVLHTGPQPAFKGFCGQRKLAHYAVRADGTRTALKDIANQPLLALAGIAKPEQFFDMLRKKGLVLDRTRALPDHYDFDSWSSNDYKGYTVICTEKDAVKLWRFYPQAWAVPLEFTPEPLFLSAFDRAVDIALSHPRLSSTDGHTTT